MTAASFDDCLRLRELADRQTLTKQDGEDLAAIADRLHALLVSRTDTRYALEAARLAVEDNDPIDALVHISEAEGT